MYIDSETFFSKFLESARVCKVAAFDIEHSHSVHPNRKNFKLHGISFATYFEGEVISRYLYNDELPKAMDLCRDLFSSDIMCVAHNGKYDIRCLSAVGLKFNEYPKQYADTMIAANFLDDNVHPNELGLKYLAGKRFGVTTRSFEESSSFGMDSPEFVEYASNDAEMTLKLWTIFSSELEQQGIYKPCVQIVCPASLVFSDVESFGMKWDIEEGRRMYSELQKERDKVEKKLYDFFGKINLNSTQQLAKFLFEDRKIGDKETAPKTKTGRIQVDDEVLTNLASKCPECGDLLLYRKICKQLGTSVGPLTEYAIESEYKRVHPSYWLVSQTGRTRSSEPNMQNQLAHPVKFGDYELNLRSGFRAEDGWSLLIADQSQLELRLIAHISKDPLLLKAYQGWKCKVCGGEGKANSILHSCPNCGVYENEKEGFWHGLDLHQQTKDLVKSIPDRSTAKCVDPRTMVYFDGEYRRIGSLCDGVEEDKFYECVGDVLSIDGRLNKCEYFYRSENKDKFAVCSRKGVVICSGTHKFLLSDGTWKSTIDLIPGDLLKEVKSFPAIPNVPYVEVGVNPYFYSNAKSCCFVHMDSHWGYLLGAITGDGCFSYADSVSICCGTGTEEYDSWGDSLVQSVNATGLQVTRDIIQTRNNGKKLRRIYIGSRCIARLLGDLGMSPKKNGETSIPESVFKSFDVACGYIAGLIDTDGYVGSGCGAFTRLCTKSSMFAGQILLLLQALGENNCKLELSWNTTYKKYYYIVAISNEFMEENVIRYMKYTKKISTIVQEKRKRPHQSMNDILEIVPYGVGELCDLSLKEDFTYLANSLVSHNTTNFAVVYGCTGETMHDNVPSLSAEEWWKIINEFFETYKGVKKWHRQVNVHLTARGYIREPFGRIRRIPREFRNSKHALNQLVNFGPQSAGANLMLICMVRLKNLWVGKGIWGSSVKIITMVHDELVIEVKDEYIKECSQDLVNVMETSASFAVPLRADCKVSKHWGVK